MKRRKRRTQHPSYERYMCTCDILKRRNGLRLSRFRPITFLNRKREAKKTGDYYAD
jgi:transcription initiation factor IIE alpha subunit